MGYPIKWCLTVGEQWGLWRVCVDALGASMLVTITLDLWRLALGPLKNLAAVSVFVRVRGSYDANRKILLH